MKFSYQKKKKKKKTPPLLARLHFFTTVLNSCFFLYARVSFSSIVLYLYSTFPLSFLELLLNVHSTDQLNCASIKCITVCSTIY